LLPQQCQQDLNEIFAQLRHSRPTTTRRTIQRPHSNVCKALFQTMRKIRQRFMRSRRQLTQQPARRLPMYRCMLLDRDQDSFDSCDAPDSPLSGIFPLNIDSAFDN
jgi:hypothetical protein